MYIFCILLCNLSWLPYGSNNPSWTAKRSMARRVMWLPLRITNLQFNSFYLNENKYFHWNSEYWRSTYIRQSPNNSLTLKFHHKITLISEASHTRNYDEKIFIGMEFRISEFIIFLYFLSIYFMFTRYFCHQNPYLIGL